MTPPITGDEDRIAELYAAVNARDLDATVACYTPGGRFADSLEGGMVEGRDAIRAHFIHLFETIRVELALLDLVREPDGRLRASTHTVTRGLGGGFWQDGVITVRYRLDQGLIAEEQIDRGASRP